MVIPEKCSKEKIQELREFQVNQWRNYEKKQSEATPSKLIASNSKAGKRSETKPTAKSDNEAAPRKRKTSTVPV